MMQKVFNNSHNHSYLCLQLENPITATITRRTKHYIVNKRHFHQISFYPNSDLKTPLPQQASVSLQPRQSTGRILTLLWQQKMSQEKEDIVMMMIKKTLCIKATR